MDLVVYTYHAMLHSPTDVKVVVTHLKCETVTKAYEDFEPEAIDGWNYLNFVVYKDGVIAEYD